MNVQKEIGKIIAPALQDPEAKKEILSKSITNSGNDYYVKISDIIALAETNTNSTIARSVKSKTLQLSEFASKLKSANAGQEPVVFFPRAETIEYRLKKKLKITDATQTSGTVVRSVVPQTLLTSIASTPYNTLAYAATEEQVLTDEEDPGYYIDPSLYGTPGYPTPTEQPIIVPGITYDQATEFADGFIVDDMGDLIPVGTVNEEYAWEHDVYVIGSEDQVVFTDLNELLGEEYAFTAPPPGRSNYEPEYGGIIQITNLGKVEGWPAGKLELMYSVVSSNGTIVKKNREFGKTKRKHFRDQKWYDYKDFLCNWDTTSVGKMMIEEWWEIDGGTGTDSHETSYSFPSACTGCPTTTVKSTTTANSNDEKLGSALVSFRDDKSQVYNISYANFKRK
ncbi:MAG: hypothetical protein ACK5NK_02200 [Niabella sp.]